MDEIEKKTSPVQPEQPSKTSRRAFLRRMGGFLAAGAATMMFGKRAVHAQPDSGSIVATETPEEKPTGSTQMASPAGTNARPENAYAAPREVVEHGVRVFYGVDNLPTHYILPDGTEVQLDQAKMLKAKENALKNKEVEFVDVFAAEDQAEESIATTPEHPVLSEIPADALSKEELAKRGVEIIQSPEVEFFIRKRAFEQDGTFAAFTEGGDKKLKVVLVDSTVVAAPFLTDPRYREVVDYLTDPGYLKMDDFLKPDFVDRFKEKQEKVVDNFRKQAQSGQSNSAYAKEQLKNAKELLFKINNLPQDQVLKLLTELSCPRGGLYIPRFVPDYPFFMYPKKSKEVPNTAVMFMAVGNSVLPKEEIQLFFDDQGEFQIMAEKNNIKSALPTEKDSMPNPQNYTTNPDADEFKLDSYAYDKRDIVLRIYHEGEHGVMTEEAMDLDEIPDTSEFRTDLGAGRRIKKVYDKWIKSGFTDDSESSFGFRLKNGNVIIFRNNTQAPAAA